MLTVAILINGNPIIVRSTVNTGQRAGKKTIYRVDDGRLIRHDPDDGAVASVRWEAAGTC